MGGGGRPDASRGRRKSTAKIMGPTSVAREGGRNVSWRAPVGGGRCAAGRIACPPPAHPAIPNRAAVASAATGEKFPAHPCTPPSA